MRLLALAVALPILGACATPAAPVAKPCNPLKKECVIGEERVSAVMKPFPTGPFLNKPRH